MANQKRSGLGRGMNSLFGESQSEVGEKPATRPVEASSAPEPVKRETQPKPEPAPAVEEPRRPATTTITEEAAEAATVRTREAAPRPSVAEAKRATPSRAEEATRKAVVQGDVAKPKPYIEEPENVTIKEVVFREKREPKLEEEVALELVAPNPDQPRTHFNEQEIDELANSIEREGLLQPILVRKVGDGYQIIAGERRWQACRKLGLKKIPIRIKDVEDDKALELALIENIQRSDLNPIEEAYGYKRLMERRGMTQAEVAQVVSKGRSTVANALRLLELPEKAQELLYEEKITAGHARAILSVPTAVGREKLTEKLREEKLSVRETEAMARLFAGQAQTTGVRNKRVPAPASFKKAARELRERLKTNVRIKTVQGKNKIEIEFADEDDLRRIFEMLAQQ